MKSPRYKALLFTLAYVIATVVAVLIIFHTDGSTGFGFISGIASLCLTVPGIIVIPFIRGLNESNMGYKELVIAILINIPIWYGISYWYFRSNLSKTS